MVRKGKVVHLVRPLFEDNPLNIHSITTNLSAPPPPPLPLGVEELVNLHIAKIKPLNFRKKQRESLEAEIRKRFVHKTSTEKDKQIVDKSKAKAYNSYKSKLLSMFAHLAFEFQGIYIYI
jgi:hypothetical protein